MSELFREKNPDYFKLYYKQNKERIDANHKKYAYDNKDKIKKYQKNYYAKKKIEKQKIKSEEFKKSLFNESI